jgi:hypothetical protein
MQRATRVSSRAGILLWALLTVNQREKPVHLTRDYNIILINVYSAPEKWDSVTQLSDINPMRGWNRKRGRDPRPRYKTRYKKQQ